MSQQTQVFLCSAHNMRYYDLMTTAPNSKALAVNFAQRLTKHLGAERIKEVILRNSTAEYDGLCASHDFCDANQVMADTLESMGFEYHNRLNEVINSAWDLAKAEGFSANKIGKPESVKLATIKREFLNQYGADLTYVVVEENGDTVVLKLLNFPERPAISIPANHLNVFDELRQSDSEE